MNITIIAYRPNGADYCMGQCQGRSDSDMDITYIEYKTDTEDLIEEMAKVLSTYYYEDISGDRDYAFYEITILIDGDEPTTNSPYLIVIDNAVKRGEDLAKIKFTKAKNAEIERKQVIKAENEEKDKIKRQEEYKKLQQEFGDE